MRPKEEIVTFPVQNGIKIDLPVGGSFAELWSPQCSLYWRK